MTDLINLIKAEYQLRTVSESLDRISLCLASLSYDQLWYRHNANTNPIGNLVVHLAGNIRQYIIAGLGGAEDHRQRDNEFSTRAIMSKQLLLELISTTIKDANEVVQGLEERIFVQKLNIQGFDHTGLSVIVHVIEHLSYHVGQITYYTKWVKDIDTGYYGDLDLSITS